MLLEHMAHDDDLVLHAASECVAALVVQIRLHRRRAARVRQRRAQLVASAALCDRRYGARVDARSEVLRAGEGRVEVSRASARERIAAGRLRAVGEQTAREGRGGDGARQIGNE